MGIPEFVAARLDECEATAQHSGPARIAWLTYRNTDGHMLYTTVAATNDGETWVFDGREMAAPTSARVVYDPAHALAEVAAKRAILAAHQHAPATEPSTHGFGCQTCAYDRGDCVLYGWGWCDTVLALAAPYANHPDYEQALAAA